MRTSPGVTFSSTNYKNTNRVTQGYAVKEAPGEAVRVLLPWGLREGFLEEALASERSCPGALAKPGAAHSTPAPREPWP